MAKWTFERDWCAISDPGAPLRTLDEAGAFALGK
jgi:hypothetical protein